MKSNKTKKMNRRRGIYLETNFSPCRCLYKEKHHTFPDTDCGRDMFEWATEGATPTGEKHWLWEARDGVCPSCGQEVTYDCHFIVTHYQENE